MEILKFFCEKNLVPIDQQKDIYLIVMMVLQLQVKMKAKPNSIEK